MSLGYPLPLRDPDGWQTPVLVLFTFHYQGSDYAVFRDPCGDGTVSDCARLTWSPWSGTRLRPVGGVTRTEGLTGDDEDLPDLPEDPRKEELLALKEALSARIAQRPMDYPVPGDHYVVDDDSWEEGQLVILRHAGPRYKLRPGLREIGRAVRPGVLFLISLAAYYFICMTEASYLRIYRGYGYFQYPILFALLLLGAYYLSPDRDILYVLCLALFPHTLLICVPDIMALPGIFPTVFGWMFFLGGVGYVLWMMTLNPYELRKTPLLWLRQSFREGIIGWTLSAMVSGSLGYLTEALVDWFRPLFASSGLLPLAQQAVQGL